MDTLQYPITYSIINGTSSVHIQTLALWFGNWGFFHFDDQNLSVSNIPAIGDTAILFTALHARKQEKSNSSGKLNLSHKLGIVCLKNCLKCPFVFFLCLTLSLIVSILFFVSTATGLGSREGDWSGFFEIDSNSGVVTQKQGIDRQRTREIILVIKVRHV